MLRHGHRVCGAVWAGADASATRARGTGGEVVLHLDDRREGFEQAEERLAAMVRTQNGFELWSWLQLRGPGSFGTGRRLLIFSGESAGSRVAGAGKAEAAGLLNPGDR